jgi:hypothetical protein
MLQRPLIAALLAGLAACSQERIEVSHDNRTDYKHAELQTAVDKFVVDDRTPAAYAALSKTILELRPEMDHAVAQEAELKLVVLALAPIQSVSAKPMPEQVAALALTVWPALLAPEIEADQILRKRDPKAVELLPAPGEDPDGYLTRLCGGPLAAECKQVVPEYQGHVISALATRRATERVRIAVADCMMCSSEPGWHEAVHSWESLDQLAHGWISEIEHKAAPSNWPISGSSSEKDPGLPEAEVTPSGEIIIGGQRYGATTRLDALRDLRFMQGQNGPIALHLRPDFSLAQVKALLVDTKKAGVTKVAVIARESRYPWERRVYWLAEGTGTRPGLRPIDSLQLLLHTLDHIASPGAVARVD